MTEPAMTHESRNRGFTLVELMVTLAVIGILGLVTVPGVFEYIPVYRVNSASKALATEMSLTRLRAISRNLVYHVEFATGTQELRIWEDADNNWATANTLVKTVSLAAQSPNVSIGYNAVTGVVGGAVGQAATFGATAAPVRATFLPNGLTTDPGVFYLIPTTDLGGGRVERMRAIQVSRAGQVERFRHDAALNPPWKAY